MLLNRNVSYFLLDKTFFSATVYFGGGNEVVGGSGGFDLLLFSSVCFIPSIY